MKPNKDFPSKILLYCLVILYFSGLLIGEESWGLSVSEKVITSVLFVAFLLFIPKAKHFWILIKEKDSKRERILYFLLILCIVGYCSAYIYAFLNLLC